jgi:hypothetical protein
MHFYSGQPMRFLSDVDSCMWGTDWTRAVGMLTYKQGVTPFGSPIVCRRATAPR